jgi:hypothetical protein
MYRRLVLIVPPGEMPCLFTDSHGDENPKCGCCEPVMLHAFSRRRGLLWSWIKAGSRVYAEVGTSPL